MPNRYELVLVPYHPFTPRQAEVIQLKSQGLSNKQIAEKLVITYESLRNLICGIGGGSKTELGIFGIIEKLTGKRPQRGWWLSSLIGDVVICKNSRTLDN